MAFVVKFLGNNRWSYRFQSGTGTPARLWFSIYDPSGGFGTTYRINLVTPGYVWTPALVTAQVRASNDGFHTVYADSTLTLAPVVPPAPGGFVPTTGVALPIASITVTNDTTFDTGSDNEPITIQDLVTFKAVEAELKDYHLTAGFDEKLDE
jgi:hypothetical protein